MLHCTPYEPAFELSPKERPVFYAAAVIIASTVAATQINGPNGSPLRTSVSRQSLFGPSL